MRTALRVLRAEGLAALRDRVADRFGERRRRRSFRAAGSPLGLSPIPVLHLLGTVPAPRLGGVQAQLLHRLAAEAERRPVALLYPEPGAWRLEAEADGRRLALRIEGLSPLSPETPADPAFERAVLRAAREVGARALHVEGLAGLPLKSLLALHGEGLQLILSVHDFSLFCPRPHLLERPELRFCEYSRDPERCARCLARDWRLPPGFQDTRRLLARELLLAAAAVVYPSEFLRDRHLELFAGLPPERQRVIEPSGPALGGTVPSADRPLRHVAFVGSVQPHKGALVFEDVVRRLPAEAHPHLRWTAYGGGDADLLLRLRRLPRVRVRGYFRAGSLAGLLRRDRVDLALLLSVVPESYSLALSECFAAGVPVAAFDHGAIAERVRRYGGGVLVDPAAGAAGVASRLAALAGGREPLPRPAPAGSSPAPGDDAGAFERLYRELGLA